MPTHKIIIRLDVLKKDGTAAVAHQVFVQGNRKVFPLGFWVKPEHFDREKQTVKIPGERETSEKMNAVLAKAKMKAQHIILDAMISGRELSLPEFVEQYSGVKNRADFLAFFEKWIEGEAGLKSPNTLKAYRVTLKNVREFQAKVSFGDFSEEWVTAFDRHLRRKKFDTNYVTKTHKLVKAVLQRAIEKKQIARNPYEGFRFVHARTERPFLDMKELEGLIDLYRSGRLDGRELEVLRYFLFSAVAGGLRLSDVKKLEVEDVEGSLLVVRPEKTTTSRTVLKIPLSQLGLSLLADTGRKSGRFFDCPDDALTNRVLKSIAIAAGIRKNLTFHMARHTFATVYLAIGGQVQVLQKILGHGKIDTTMLYVHIAHEQKVREMGNFDAVFGQIVA